MAVSVEAHLRNVIDLIEPLGTEVLPLTNAHGHILAADLTARFAVPPFTNSAMDGFAVRAADVAPAAPDQPVVLQVIADIPAGTQPETPVGPGQAARIMTGAPLPPGADAVVAVEDTNIPPGPHPLPDEVTVGSAVAAGRHVRRAGENVAVGDQVLTAGTRLGPTALSAAASVGHGAIPVKRRPRVAVVSTGAELVPAGTALSPGQIPDSNSLLLSGLLTEDDATPVMVRSAGDDATDLAAALRGAGAQADLILTTGGVSAGAFDVVKELTATQGIDFYRVAMQPGKPQGHGLFQAVTGRRIPLLALPGNPVSVFVSYLLFVRPALAALRGIDPDQVLHTLAATASTSWNSPANKHQYVPVDFDPDTGEATPTHRLGSSSHLVASLPHATALAIIPPEVTTIDAGDPISVLPIRGF